MILNCNNISQYYSFYCIFDQINAALVCIRNLFQKHLKNCTKPEFLNSFVNQFLCVLIKYSRQLK